ncbi:hypothetical protein [Thauera sp. WH-1]|uniref:hypothetical protein n=1 Tax=Thauera sp. WH-1 TaxID=3398230 RepID=UPI0039FCC204
MRRIGLLALVLVTMSSNTQASAIGAIGSLIIKFFGDAAASRELVQSGRAVREGAETLPATGRPPNSSSAPTEAASSPAVAPKPEREDWGGPLPLVERDVSRDEVLRRGVAGGRSVLEHEKQTACADGNGGNALAMEGRSGCGDGASY